MDGQGGIEEWLFDEFALQLWRRFAMVILLLRVGHWKEVLRHHLIETLLESDNFPQVIRVRQWQGNIEFGLMISPEHSH